MTRQAVLVACVTVIAAHLPAQAGRVEHLTRGDTSIVRTTGNGVWGAPRMAVELRRVGGTTTRETTFNRILSLTILPNGAVALYDDKSLDGPIIRLLDADGHFIRNVGRIGSGPGEYRSGMTSLSTSLDGNLMISDPMNARASIFATDGRYVKATRIVVGNMGIVDMVRSGARGDLFVVASFVAPGRAELGTAFANLGFIHLDSTGQVLDSIRPPTFANGFTSGIEPNILPDGRMVLISSDRAAVLIAPSRSVGHGLIAELAMPRVAYASDERKEIEAGRAMLLNSPGRSGATDAHPTSSRPPVPEFKPSIAGIKLDGKNRIWLQRSVASTKGEATTSPSGATYLYHAPVVFDAFQPDGTFLGEVAFPTGVRIMAFSGDIAWGWLTGSDDEIYLVKYKLR